MKRTLAGVMAAVVLAVSVITPAMQPEIAKAAPNNDFYYQKYLTSATNRCAEFQGFLDDVGDKKFGLLFSLRILGQYSTYTQYLIKWRNDENFSDSTVKLVLQDLAGQYDAFNDKFSNKSTFYNALEIKHEFTGYTKDNKNGKNQMSMASNDIRKFLCVTLPQYMKNELQGIQDEITNAGNDKAKIEKIKRENSTVLSNIYSIYDYTLEAKADLDTMTAFKSDGSHKKWYVKYDNKSMEDAFREVANAYPDLFAYAKEIALAEETDEEISVDLTKHYVDNLSNAVSTSEIVEVPKTPKFSKLYYAIMAAGATYVPFQSYAGNVEFQKALRSLTNDDQMQKDILEFYSAVKDIRKPVYKRTLNEEGKMSGVAKILTIDDYIKDIENGNSIALCAVLGKFTYRDESGSWIYEMTNDRTYYDRDGNEDDAESNDFAISTSNEGSTNVQQSSPDTEASPSSALDPVQPTATPQTVSSTGIVDWIKSVVMPKKARAATPQPDTVGPPAPSATNAATATTSPSAEPSAEPTIDPENSDDSVSGDDMTDEDVVDDSAVYAYPEITDETKLTDALYMISKDYLRDVDNMTYALMYNSVKGASNLNYISDKTTRYVYVNAFGDLVTDDNMVIFPGIANPLIYNKSEKYNPYTAAFMNFYPTACKTSKFFKLSNKASIGKYLICNQATTEQTEVEDYYGLETTTISAIKNTSPLRMKELFLPFSANGRETLEVLKYKRMIFNSSKEWNDESDLYLYTPLVVESQITSEGYLVFPYDPTNDFSGSAAITIAANMYSYLTTDIEIETEEDGNVDSTLAVSRFNTNYVLHNFVISGVDGTNNPKGYSANALDQYQKYVQSSSDRTLAKIIDYSKKILDVLKDVQGLIGLRESMQSPILGYVLTVCRDNFIVYLLIMSIILLIAFMKLRLDRLQLVIKFFLGMLGAYLFITVVPTYVPMIFNIVINNVSENLTYKILGMKLERESIEVKGQEVEEDGSLALDDGSITVYRSGAFGYSEYLKELNVDNNDIAGGNYYTLNEESGFYAEGDSLKYNTSSLFNTLKIAKDDGEEEDEEEEEEKEESSESEESKVENKKSPTADKLSVSYSSAYKLKAYKTVSNNFDYYAPFYQITDSFIAQLDDFQTIAGIPRNAIIYSNGVVKDNFLVYSFVNSQVFLSPGKYKTPFSVEGLTHEERLQMEEEQNNVQSDFLQTFGDTKTAEDFLGLSRFLLDPSEYEETLWYKSMQKTGYIDKNGKPDEEKMGHLISKVNRVTKKFIFDSDDMVGQISDDTMIKLIAMRATIAFNQEISDFGSWVYPFCINYGDITLGDVVSCIFISDYSRYSALNLDPIEYVGYTDGSFTLIVFDIVIVLMFILAWVMQLLIPVLYLVFALSLLYKLFTSGQKSDSAKGFVKCTVVLMACYTVFTVALVFIEKMNGSVICIYMMLLLCILVAFFILAIGSSVAQNWVDVGNAALRVTFDRLPGFSGLSQRFSSIRANKIIPKYTGAGEPRESRRGLYGDDYDPYSIYDDDASIDDLYSDNYNVASGYDEDEFSLDPNADYNELPDVTEGTGGLKSTFTHNTNLPDMEEVSESNLPDMEEVSASDLPDMEDSESSRRL